MDEVASQLSPWGVLLKDDLILLLNHFAILISLLRPETFTSLPDAPPSKDVSHVFND